MNVGKKHVDPEHLARIKDKEIENAEQQKAFYEAEIDRLERRIDELSGVEKVLELEELVTEDKARILELRKVLKDLEKVKKENGETLERLTEGDVYANKMKGIITEIKIWKDKQDRLDRKYAASDEIEIKQKERQGEVQKQIDELKSKISSEGKGEREPAKTSMGKEELLRKLEEKEKLKEAFEERQKELGADFKAR